LFGFPFFSSFLSVFQKKMKSTQQQHKLHMMNCSKNNKKNDTRWLLDNSKKESDIWTSTNYTEERQRIREFWLQLSEFERRSLVKVEKEAVLRKMKEQQRHSCNCSVCGKKR
jgi:excinuclease UvrABC ATPase subunit